MGDTISLFALGFTVITWLLGISFFLGRHAQKIKDIDEVLKDSNLSQSLGEIRTDIKHIMRVLDRCPGAPDCKEK